MYYINLMVFYFMVIASTGAVLFTVKDIIKYRRNGEQKLFRLSGSLLIFMLIFIYNYFTNNCG